MNDAKLRRPALRINAVAHMTGISIDTIRAWERRYGAIAPQRSDNGRRTFTGEDVERLTFLHEIVAANIATISKIAGLPTEELRVLARAATRGGDSDDAAVMRLLKLIARRDSLRLLEELLNVARSRKPAAFAEDVINAVIAELQRDHDTSRASQLLLASTLASICSTLTARYHVADAPTIISSALGGAACPVSPVLATLVAAEAGFNALYLDPTIDSAELSRIARRLNAEYVAFAVNAPQTHSETVMKLRENLRPIDLLVYECDAYRDLENRLKRRMRAAS
jgi:MerR family transcriptional regulator, light-induced transcriptional regulator